MKGYSQAIDVGAGSCLRFAVLFWGGVARRAKRGGILRLSWLEEAGDAKIDEEDVSVSGEHDIGGFEVAKNNGWLV